MLASDGRRRLATTTTVGYTVASKDQLIAAVMAAAISNKSTFAAALANGINSAGSAIGQLSATDVKPTDPFITTKIYYSVQVKVGQSLDSITEVTGNTTTMTALANSAKVPGTKDITTVAVSSEVQASTPLVIEPVAAPVGFLAYLGTPTAAVVVLRISYV